MILIQEKKNLKYKIPIEFMNNLDSKKKIMLDYSRELNNKRKINLKQRDINNNTKNKLKHNYINLNQTINEINDFNYDGDNSCSEDSFENMCMKTARNKWRNKKEEPMKQEKININIEETPKRMWKIKVISPTIIVIITI